MARVALVHCDQPSPSSFPSPLSTPSPSPPHPLGPLLRQAAGPAPPLLPHHHCHWRSHSRWSWSCSTVLMVWDLMAKIVSTRTLMMVMVRMVMVAVLSLHLHHHGCLHRWKLLWSCDGRPTRTLEKRALSPRWSVSPLDHQSCAIVDRWCVRSSGSGRQADAGAAVDNHAPQLVGRVSTALQRKSQLIVDTNVPVVLP